MEPEPKRKSRRARRRFTPEYKASVVQLIVEEKRPISQVAKELGLTETSVREWVKRAEEEAGKGVGALTSAEREELTRLRREVRQVKMERDILKKAAAFFANPKR